MRTCIFFILAFLLGGTLTYGQKLIAPEDGASVNLAKNTPMLTFKWAEKETRKKQWYQIRLCEIQEGQDLKQAIKNEPVWTHKAPFAQITVNLSDLTLNTNSSYVWQVKKLNKRKQASRKASRQSGIFRIRFYQPVKKLTQDIAPNDTSIAAGGNVYKYYKLGTEIDTSCCQLKAEFSDFCDLKPVNFPNCCPEDLFSRNHRVLTIGGQREMMFGAAFMMIDSQATDGCPVIKESNYIKHKMIYSIIDDCENIPGICESITDYDCAPKPAAPVKIVTLIYKNGTLLSPGEAEYVNPHANISLSLWDENQKKFEAIERKNTTIEHIDYGLICTDIGMDSGQSFSCSALLQAEISIHDPNQLSAKDEYVIVTYIAEHNDHDHRNTKSNEESNSDKFPPQVSYEQNMPDLMYFYNLKQNAHPSIAEHIDIIPLPVQGTETCEKFRNK